MIDHDPGIEAAEDGRAPGAGGARRPIVTGADYVESLRGRGLRVFFLGERVEEPVDHPVIRPSINAVAETYEPRRSRRRR